MFVSSLVKGVVTMGLMMRNIRAAGLVCKTDAECVSGFYCASTSVCLRCYNCTQHYMQATDDCSKSIIECGNCLPGYVLVDNKLEGCAPSKNSTLPYWPALLAAAVAFILFLIWFLARHILTRKRNADTVHARPALNGDDKANPTAPPPEEYTRLNPNHVEGRTNGYQPTANGPALESQDDTPLLVTSISPPPYSTVLNEILASSHPSGPTASAPDDVSGHGRPSQNGSNPAQHTTHAPSDVTGHPYDDTNYTSQHPSDDAPPPSTRNGNVRNQPWTANHPRVQKGHPKDSHNRRVREIRQMARKYNNPIYDTNEMVSEHVSVPIGQNETPEWLYDEDTMESVWSPHAPGAAATATSGATSTDTTSPPSNVSEVNISETASDPVACLRVTTRARTDDEGPPRTRRRMATDNNRMTEVGERTLVIRSPVGAAPSPPASGDDLTPEDGARRPVYSYNVINIQPELSIVAKIK